MTGPVEQALQEVLGAALGGGIGAATDTTRLPVRAASPSAAAEFKVDLRPLLGDRAGERDSLTDCARHWRRLAAVRDVVIVPPALYVSPSLPFLHEVTTRAIAAAGEGYGSHDGDRGQTSVVSFSSPNVNKPLHVGHLRNNFLGMSLARLLQSRGRVVRRDDNQSNWGVHICQAVLAYRLWGGDRTPASCDQKGDHFVGDFYVRFHRESARLRGSGDGPTVLEEQAQELLRRMEAGDRELTELNDRITGWARAGITATYARIGTRMDFVVQERDTLDVARRVVERGLREGRCQRRTDGSVCVDLRDLGSDPVTLVRRDGTPVVYLQHLGSRVHRYHDLDFDRVLMVMGLEWRSGNKMVEGALLKLGYEWARKIEPVHYGTVVLPEGRMRSRSGTGVEADSVLDRFASVFARAWAPSHAPTEAQRGACDRLAVALLKLHFLGQHRDRDIVYEEQRIWRETLPKFDALSEVLRTASAEHPPIRSAAIDAAGDGVARRLLLQLNAFPHAVEVAYSRREPAHLVRTVHQLVDQWHRWRRTALVPPSVTEATAAVLRAGLRLLNIDLPDTPAALAVRVDRDGAGEPGSQVD